MSRQQKSSQSSIQVEQLAAEVAALKARLSALEGGTSDGNGQNGNGPKGPQSRRDLLKIAGAAVAGAAGTVLLNGVPAAASGNVQSGPNTSNDATVTTDLYPSTPASPAPLLQATGQGVSTTTSVLPFATLGNGPASQTIPLIGAIAPGGSLPPIGSPPVPDYPGWAPIQGIGGVLTAPDGKGGTEDVSEGINGWGGGPNAKGVFGTSDQGYGVAGGSGGIDIAALGLGRVLQLSLPDTELTGGGPVGPPNYPPNDFEQVRDKNGNLWLSGPNATWRRHATVRVDTPDGTGLFVPVRIVDTRSTSPSLNWGHPGPLAPGRTYDFGPFTNTNGIPSDAIGINGNLTAIAALGPQKDGLPTFKNQGYLTIFPKGVAQPVVSNVNFGGQTYAWPNFFTVAFGSGANQGMFTIYVFEEAVNVLVDVFAYIQ